MKLYSKIILTAVLGLASFTVQAGDYCFTPGRSCNVQAPSDCCDNSGYLFAYGGFSFLNDIDANILNSADVFTRTGVYPGTRERIHMDNGFIIGGGAGVRSSFLCGSRFEIEGLYMENDYESAFNETLNLQIDNLNGQVSTAAVMFNFLKEVPIGCFTGYIGGGFGIAQTESDLELFGQYVSDQDYSFAHQFIVGADIPVADCLSLFVQYKLFNSGDVDLLCPTGAAPLFGAAGPEKLSQFEGGYNSSLVFGARFFY